MQICHAEKSKLADDVTTLKKESFVNRLFEKSCSKEPICELCIQESDCDESASFLWSLRLHYSVLYTSFTGSS